jgi:hypothetical protein
MAIQYSTTVRNAMLQALKDSLGTNAVFRVFGSSLPANCAAADTGTILGHINISGAAFEAPSGGVMAQVSGGWTNYPADDDGTASHFRLYDSGLTCHIQGTIGTSSGDMLADNLTMGAGDKFNPAVEVTVLSFTITEGNA